MRRQITFVTYLVPDLYERVRSLEHELASVTGSRASLEIWEPHVTVGSEVYVEDEDIYDMERRLQQTVAVIRPFSVALQGIGFVESSSMGHLAGFSKSNVHIRVQKTQELEHLASLVERHVTRGHEKYYSLSHPYQSHLTVAFKDLTDEGFAKGRKLLEHRPFEAEMTFDHVAMAIREDDGRYVEYSRFPLAQ